ARQAGRDDRRRRRYHSAGGAARARQASPDRQGLGAVSRRLAQDRPRHSLSTPHPGSRAAGEAIRDPRSEPECASRGPGLARCSPLAPIVPTGMTGATKARRLSLVGRGARSVSAGPIALYVPDPRSRSAAGLHLLQLAGLLAASALVIFQHEADTVALVERANVRLLERRCVHEHVLAAAFRLDEPVALGGVKELHGTCDAHVGSSFSQ